MRLAVIITFALALAARSAHAFCGFYVAGGDGKLVNDATQVVLMRDGTRTVLAMQNSYKGPPEAFAMVVPVPVVLHEGDVKTLPRDVFERVEQMGAPRLVEYWEQDPCAPAIETELVRGIKVNLPSGATMEIDSHGVKVEAKFAVGEYQIVILSAKDSTGLDAWLHQQGYKIPADAEPLLRPYVEAGSKFFVAKVDPAKVTFDADGRAQLSPLRFHYDSDDFALPIRLGIANSAGTQDLIVNILAPHQRYAVANYKNAFIPTNIDVVDSVRDRFPAFYAALFDRTLETHPGAVVTEYAWQASTCDPCPAPRLGPADFALLGADVIATPGADFVLTRLHARYGKTLADDLHFAAAPPVAGGREFVRAGDGALETGVQPAPANMFQGRYAIRHPWTGPIRCEHPRRGVWGEPPGELARGSDAPAIKPAIGLAFAARGAVTLAQVVRRDVPEIDVHAGPRPPAEPSHVTPPAAPSDGKVTGKKGCSCEASDSGSLMLLLGTVAVVVRRRRPAVPRGR